MTRRPAQSMLEAIIAIGIILVATIASLTLIFSTINLGRESQNQVEAVNFAREGIEAVRAVRDSNWLKIDQNIQDGPDGLTKWDDTGESVGYQSLDRTIGAAPCADCVGMAFFSPENGWEIRQNNPDDYRYSARRIYGIPDIGKNIIYYSQWGDGGNSLPVNWIPTRYFRTITIRKQTEGSQFTSGTDLEYLDVVSTVEWEDSGKHHTTTAEEHLYNWK